MVVPVLRMLAGLALVRPKSPGLVAYSGGDAGLYLVRRGLFMPWEMPGLFDRDFVLGELGALHPAPAFITAAIGELPANDFAAVTILEAVGYVRNQFGLRQGMGEYGAFP